MALSVCLATSHAASGTGAVHLAQATIEDEALREGEYVAPRDASAFEGEGDAEDREDHAPDRDASAFESEGDAEDAEDGEDHAPDRDASAFEGEGDAEDREDHAPDRDAFAFESEGDAEDAENSDADLDEDAEADAERPTRVRDLQEPDWGFSRGEEEEPWMLDDSQLRASGWEFRDRGFRRGSPLAGFAALTAGIPFHGVGHLMVGDNDAMFRLLISEVVALGVTGIGTLMRNAATRRNGVWATGAALQVSGLSVFAAGWLADVVGSFKGTTVPLPTNSIDFKGVAADVHYTILFSDEVDVTSVGVVGFQWGTDRVFIRPEFSFGPADNYYRGSLFAEYRHPLKLGENTYLTVWGEVGEEFVASKGWGREILLGGLGLSVDLGDILQHTRGLVWKLRVGAGVQSFHYASQGHRLFLRRNIRVMLPVETSMAMNLNRGLNVEIGYQHRPDELVGALSRFGGALYQQFTVLPIDRLGISIRLEEGAYFRLWAGVRYFFKAPEL